MKKHLFIFCLLTIGSLSARVSTDRIKGWLELDDIQKNIQNMMQKYQNLDIQLKDDANKVLQQGIDGADELAQSDPYAALVMYHKIKNLKDTSARTSLEIAAVNKQFQESSDYIDAQYKALLDMRRKHLQFPF